MGFEGDVILALFASTGLWSVINMIIQYKLEQKRSEKRNQTPFNNLVKGIAHDRIVYLGMECIERGYILQSEYNNIVNYLYKPYKELGGNGMAEKIVEELKELEIRKDLRV